MRRREFIAAAIIAALPALAPMPVLAHDHGGVTVSSAWSRPNLPSRPAAVYFTIENAGTETERLVGLKTPAFARTELHTVKKDGEAMTMIPVEAVEIPAGGKVVFAPGGFHGMLFDAQATFKEGETWNATLIFETAGEVEIEVDVSRRGPKGHGHGHDHGDHSHGHGHSHGEATE